MPRAARLVVAGHPHHILQKTFEGRPAFYDMGDYFAFLEQLRRFRDQYRLEILAWCLMPDHFHLLAAPEKTDALAKGIGSTCLVHSQHLNRKYKRSGHIWQARFYSAVVDQGDYLLAAARAIELNPVRAGKVRRAEEWPWSSARHHLTGRRDPLVNSAAAFPDPGAWRDWLNTEDDGATAALVEATKGGRPFAGPTLIAELERLTGRRLTKGKPGRPRKQLDRGASLQV